MLTYDLNHRGQSSIYEYLYQCIRQDIQTGVLTAGNGSLRNGAWRAISISALSRWRMLTNSF